MEASMSSLLQSYKPEVLVPAQIGGPRVNQTLVLAAAVVPAIAILLLVRVPLVLPSLSLVSMASAAVIVLLAWWMSVKRTGEAITLWDVAGLYAFLGCAAGMLSDPEQAMEFLALPASGPEAVGKAQ
jgi:hypothetical protein